MENSPSRNDLISFICKIYPMPLQQAGEIAAYFKPREFSKGDFIIKKGRPNNEYHFMIKGFARAFTHDLEGNDVTTAFYGQNQIMCELFSFFTNSFRMRLSDVSVTPR